MAARRIKLIGATVAVVLVAGALAGVGAVRYENGTLAGPRGTAATSRVRTTSPRVARLPAASVSPAPQTSLAPVLASVEKPAGSDPTAVAQKVASAGGVTGGHISAAVMSADTGKLLYDQDAATGLIPASVTKLLTASAALQLLGPEHRFRTAVVNGPTTRHGKARTHQIVLVGGGDPYLTNTRKEAADPGQASLQALAAATAKKLTAEGVTDVQVGYDASLFSGPAWNPTWPAGYKTVVSPTTALWVNEGRVDRSQGPRQPQPAEVAARDFAAQLGRRGIKISGVIPAKAPAAAAEIAGVDSLPLNKIIERLLMISDNDAAEVIARQVAIADGRPGTITDGLNSIKKVLAGLGVWAPGTRMYDGSGLSRAGRIPTETLVKVLRLGVDGDQPSLGPVLTGLPVAGVEGSLQNRFDSSSARVGRGLVRAKTGTLTGVHSLAGYTYTRDGELLIFAFVVNGAKSDYSATLWLDRVSAAVASCGCAA